MKNLNFTVKKAWVYVIQIAVLAVGFLPLVSQADTVTQEIRVSELIKGGTVSINPSTETNTIGPNLAFHVINDSGKPVSFSIPKLGISYYVSADTQPTFFVSITPYMDPQIAYQIQDLTGNQLAYGSILNEASQMQIVASNQNSGNANMTNNTASNTSRSQYQSNTWSASRNETVSPTPVSNPMGSHHHHRTWSHSIPHVVRGYW